MIGAEGGYTTYDTGGGPWSTVIALAAVVLVVLALFVTWRVLRRRALDES